MSACAALTMPAVQDAFVQQLVPHPAQAALQYAVYGAALTASPFMELVSTTSFQQVPRAVCA